MVVKTDTCAFSGFKIYPGHGIRYVPVVSATSTRPVFPFINKRSMGYFRSGKNPRDLAWTIIYRRNHKKGILEQFKKSKRKKAKKLLKSIVGASVEYIKSQQDQTAEQRAQILKAAKKAEEERRKKISAKKAAASKKKEETKKDVKKQKSSTTSKVSIPKHQNKNKGKTTSK